MLKKTALFFSLILFGLTTSNTNAADHIVSFFRCNIPTQQDLTLRKTALEKLKDADIAHVLNDASWTLSVLEELTKAGVTTGKIRLPNQETLTNRRAALKYLIELDPNGVVTTATASLRSLASLRSHLDGNDRTGCCESMCMGFAGCFGWTCDKAFVGCSAGCSYLFSYKNKICCFMSIIALLELLLYYHTHPADEINDATGLPFFLKHPSIISCIESYETTYHDQGASYVNQCLESIRHAPVEIKEYFLGLVQQMVCVIQEPCSSTGIAVIDQQPPAQPTKTGWFF